MAKEEVWGLISSMVAPLIIIWGCCARAAIWRTHILYSYLKGNILFYINVYWLLFCLNKINGGGLLVIEDRVNHCFCDLGASPTNRFGIVYSRVSRFVRNQWINCTLSQQIIYYLRWSAPIDHSQSIFRGFLIFTWVFVVDVSAHYSENKAVPSIRILNVGIDLNVFYKVLYYFWSAIVARSM